MEYRVLGTTGIKVSALCFGTMSFGGDADKETSRGMFNRCLEAGINFFDTADVYNQELQRSGWGVYAGLPRSNCGGYQSLG